MLPCSTASHEWRLRVKGFRKLATQQHRVPRGERVGRKKKNPRKGLHEGREELNSRKKHEKGRRVKGTMREKNGEGENRRREWKERGGAEPKMQMGAERFCRMNKRQEEAWRGRNGEQSTQAWCDEQVSAGCKCGSQPGSRSRLPSWPDGQGEERCPSSRGALTSWLTSPPLLPLPATARGWPGFPTHFQPFSSAWR